MKLMQLLDYLRDPKRALMRRVLLALVVLDVLDTLPLLVDKHHAHTWIEALPGFWTLFGLLGCIVIILVSKWFGHAGIMTREDYYDE